MILVTGATGHVGGAISRRLVAGGHPVAALARDAERGARAVPGAAVRVADYDDRDRLGTALAGVVDLVMIASDGEARDVLRHHANLIDAAAAAGVRHVVFTTIVDVADDSPFYYAPIYRDAERRLTRSGLAHTLVRCGLYTDFVWSHWLAPARTTGELALPVGNARVAPISRDDVAEAVAAVAADRARRGRTYALTGARALTFAELAGLAGARFTTCPPPDYLARAWAAMDDPWPHAFSTLCASIAAGHYAGVSSAAADLLGRPPEDAAGFVARVARAGRAG